MVPVLLLVIILQWPTEYRTSWVFEWSISAGAGYPNTRPFKNRTYLFGFRMVSKPWFSNSENKMVALTIWKLEIYVLFSNGLLS
jgi:hypothetical protein